MQMPFVALQGVLIREALDRQSSQRIKMARKTHLPRDRRFRKRVIKNTPNLRAIISRVALRSRFLNFSYPQIRRPQTHPGSLNPSTLSSCLSS
jgi:hypothetical protein